jgi:hypothetical protein
VTRRKTTKRATSQAERDAQFLREREQAARQHDAHDARLLKLRSERGVGGPNERTFQRLFRKLGA